MSTNPIITLHSSFPLSRKVYRKFSPPSELDYSSLQSAKIILDWLRSKAHRESLRVTPGELTAIGLMGRILYQVLDNYRADHNPQLVKDYFSYLVENLDAPLPYAALVNFTEMFPPPALLTEHESAEEFLSRSRDNFTYFQLETFSLLLYMLVDENPAFKPYSLLFSDPLFSNSAPYLRTSQAIGSYYKKQPGFLPGESLLAFLKKPFLESPESISGQLIYMLNNWGDHINCRMLVEVQRCLDFIREDQKAGGGVPGSIEVPDYSSRSEKIFLEKRMFSPDQDWMPEVVLLAKNIYVWLEQLSRSYHQEISRLDQIPDEELRKLSSWGVSSLWLIGIWKRSPASKKIKQLCGNPDAEASAYALYDYEIADDLGGEVAYKSLERLSKNFGIRLAADMVPNHVGIDSKWVRDRPDWFVSLPDKPFSSYSYQGPDLVDSQELSVYLEDHYYNKSDAAVVFKRVDRNSGRTRYIYHGNDGTAMPWNDTAQLNFLNQEVRSAVIKTIIKVAKKFSVIRFDAAMTLSKKHFQRLWFPEPGTGGAIPSRSEHGLSKKEFDQLFPREFWREVVDRIAEEAPNTLLLAEAFWMMEGYFVRTLGMHRVYNSAFMNMLKNELNSDYRKLIKDTLAYDPQILKRYVNFMNNPDEETAVAQFGKEGKYFGVCLLMTTLPGLPMFGHGQIEGYTEKYGMEYRRPYYDEQPDHNLIARHEKEIFPLLRKRYLFAEVNNFVLYDFVQEDGKTNEDVFVYSNHSGSEKALIVFHNKWGDTRGSIQYSASAHNSDLDLNQALNLKLSPGKFLTYRDQTTGLEYIHSSDEILSSGLTTCLGAYHYHAFLDFEQSMDSEGSLKRLADKLSGRGVPDINAEIEVILFERILEFLENYITPQLLKDVFSPTVPAANNERIDFSSRQVELTKGLQEKAQKLPDRYLKKPATPISNLSVLPLEIIHNLYQFNQPLITSTTLLEQLVLLGCSAICPLMTILSSEGLTKLIDLSSKRIAENFNQVSSDQIALALKTILQSSADPKIVPPISVKPDLNEWFTKEPEKEYLQVHKHQDKLWFKKEAFSSLLALKLLKIAVNQYLSTSTLPSADPGPFDDLAKLYLLLLELAEESNYQVEKLLTA